MSEPRWERLESRCVHAGRMRISEYRVRLPNGEEGLYEVDESCPFAVAVLLRDDQHVLLSRQYRFPLDAWIYDLPGGAGEPGEEPMEAARREVAEELGLEVDDLVPLQSYYPNPGRSSWAIHLFFGTVTGRVGAADDDPWERVYERRLAGSEVARMVRDGEVHDPSLLIAWHSAIAKGLVVV